MGENSKKVLQELLQRPGNDTCADCGAVDPDWASCNLGIFICKECAGIHRSLGAHISRVKSVKLDNWDKDHLQSMDIGGNTIAKKKYEEHVPACYRRPTQHEPLALREQWIRAKYERKEFCSPQKQHYLSGNKDGYLWKLGKDDKKFFRRKFILIETEGILKYYTKDESKSSPKAVLRLDNLGVMLVPEKMGNPNGLQLTFEKDKHTRSIYVYTETAKDLVDWYTAIRSAQLNRLRIAYPGTDDSELVVLLTQDFIKEGWLSKTGPRPSDAFRKRWVSLDKRKLMYYEDPMDAFPKGEIYLGTTDKGFAVREGVPPGIKDPGFSFTLKTPDRHFHFAAEMSEDQVSWMAVLKSVLVTPLSPQDSSNIAQGHRKRSSLPSPFK